MASAAGWGSGACAGSSRPGRGGGSPLELRERPPGSRPSSSTSDLAPPVGGERVRLAPGAIEREHQLAAKALAQRLRGDQRLELADEVGVAPERELGLDPLLEGAPAELLEAAASAWAHCS